MKRLPPWLGRGAEVSDIAYRVCIALFDLGHDLQRFPKPAELAEHLFVDEADVLRAFAELKQKEVLV